MITLGLSVHSRASIVAVGAALVLFAGCSDDGNAAADAGSSGVVHTVFLNPNATEFTSGSVNDSVANVTTMFSETVMTTGLPASAQAIWPEVVSCLEAMLAPYDVSVVDEEPGDVDHIELAVSDRPADVGLSSPVISLAPTTCEPLTRGIGFVFAGVTGNAQAACENLGWLIGHIVGLDTVYHCPDVNTFLSGCGPKSFTDNDSPCGEYETRACSCGGTTQNSHQRMLEVFGARP